ncbi:MAG: glutamate racemase [Endomicrobiales bacterium]|nr:glutamate racemase [Endomicrobiales bacterium]
MKAGRTRSTRKNARPVGIFDSGLGGLTVMASVIKRLPNENVVYFGDTAHVPYGSKSAETVIKYSTDIADFLAKKNVKMIVVACNTASAVATKKLRSKFGVPVIEVILPGAETAAKTTRNGKVGVIGTEGTIGSSCYKKAIRKIDGSISVFGKACPLFVPLVEEGWLNHNITKQVAKEYVRPLLDKNIDTLVLGCTHYPLIKRVIRSVAGVRIKLIDSADAAARKVEKTLEDMDLKNRSRSKGRREFYVSDIPRKFSEMAKRFLGSAISPVKKVDIVG